MAADGSDQRRLTTTAGLDEGPSWSPGGSRIAFTSTRSGTSDIWTMAADGTDQQPLTALAGYTEESPDWQALPAAPAPGPAVVSAPTTTVPSPAALKVALALASGQSLRTVRRRGLVIRITCSRACTLDLRLRHGQSTARRVTLRATAGRRKVTIRPTRRARVRLAAVTSARLSLRVTASAGGRRQSVERRVILTRTRARLSRAAR